MPPARSTPSSAGQDGKPQNTSPPPRAGFSQADIQPHASFSAHETRNKSIWFWLSGDSAPNCHLKQQSFLLCLLRALQSYVRGPAQPELPSKAIQVMGEVTSKVQSCDHTRPQIYRSAKHLCISPHTGSLCPCTRRSRQSHLFFPLLLINVRIPGDQRSKAPAEPLACGFAEPRGHRMALQVSFRDIPRLVCRHESAFPFIRTAPCCSQTRTFVGRGRNTK